MKYARIIIDISAEQVDRAFTYRIPKELEKDIRPGVRVQVPFGASNHFRSGFVIGLTDRADFEETRIKNIEALLPKAMDADGSLIELAAWMAEEYGCTMNQALLTVLPVKRSIRKNSKRTDPVHEAPRRTREAPLTPEQSGAVEGILQETKRPSLLFGITGSGKTRVYIELIRRMQAEGKQSIVLIPEISLTYQTVRELTSYLGNRVAVMHSRLSQGEKYEQMKKAAAGEIDVMVGPRSALFTRFPALGLIIIDEEHERTYHSDTAPRYDTREAAAKRADMAGARLVLGSATPSLESYQRARQGEYALFTLPKRAMAGAGLPRIYVEDMRRELQEGNRDIFSVRLREMIEERLDKGEQTMLFLNRRGYAGFVSCRSCGYVVKCPHCDVSMTAHNNWYTDPHTGKKSALLMCHYCGTQIPMPARCPSCGSPYIAPFGTGTQKLEQAVRNRFPKARVLRMDADATTRKGSYEKILRDFYEGKADILIGTQMIVKGHDFENVTLVGIVAADLSLNTSEYDASERTFQLITQAAGRSGRGRIPGDVVIQSYDPSHYAITCAAAQDYSTFFEREMSYRKLLHYPPDTVLMKLQIQSTEEVLAEAAAARAAAWLSENLGIYGASFIGPCNESVYRVNETYRKILYIKHGQRDIIKKIRDGLEKLLTGQFGGKNVYFSFDIR